MAKLFIGTSGWNYSSWKDSFYPAGLPSSKFLEYYAQQFNCTEVNYSFYHLPKQSTYQRWHETVPRKFIFAVKTSRFITHTKRLDDIEVAWNKFNENAKALSMNLGPILLQFPASFELDLRRLAKFLKLKNKNQPDQKIVFEFRHSSWFVEEVYSMLSAYNAALCIADSEKYPCIDKVTADFAYFRYHGPQALFASSYSNARITSEAKKMQRLLNRQVEIYAFFNNDAKGHAVKNARTLQELLK